MLRAPIRYLIRTLLLTALAGLVLMGLLIAALRVAPPPTTAFMLQSPVRPVQYQWIDAAAIPAVARRAAVAAEDQKFYNHRGFDLDAIQRAMRDNPQRQRPRGASTISQQLAKNLFLWPGGGLFRKGLEAGITVFLEVLLPKDRILTLYLNIAEFAPGVYGIEAASRHYYGKPAQRLTAREAAQLAAVLPSPRRWRAQPPGDYVRERSEWILGQMARAG